ncbi:hypothetical protein Pan44_04730 [Caulifigura coniformis]|uniref:Uncharacterized protein n=1 Tax=Caulifigura coniformis TaxID=2527983 RepID=A0A517S8K6_9PLAN|nr:hypothetical protein [Caulifigura coniformis]QDT52461.1 hypothetical protein Pan44_04730 [Caulifigura coniformis]
MSQTILRSALLAITGCVFLASPSLAHAVGPDGTWSGEWISSSSGHQGPIKAHIRQVDACTYRACFCGRFLHVVPFAYSVPMKVTGRTASGATVLTAQSWLPGFGDFTCRAHVSQCQFNACYVSPKDRGRFVMTRM